MNPSGRILLVTVSTHERRSLERALEGLSIVAFGAEDVVAAEREMCSSHPPCAVVIDAGLMAPSPEQSRWNLFRRQHAKIPFLIRELITESESPQPCGSLDWILHPEDVVGLRSLLLRLSRHGDTHDGATNLDTQRNGREASASSNACENSIRARDSRE